MDLLTGQEFIFSPDLSPGSDEAALRKLLRGGDLMDRYLRRYCERLDERFAVYLARFPAVQWAHGLRLSGEIRSQHEVYLPMEEIVPPFAHLCRCSCRYPVDTDGVRLFASPSWPDFLSRLRADIALFNPATLLQRLAADDGVRRRFLFNAFIPPSFGGGFGRYPRQTVYLSHWLAANRERLSAGARVLDAACGCGEGTYEVAELLLDNRYSADATRVHGSTLEPLELVAAAFGARPDDPARGALFRERIKPLLHGGGSGMILFYREDVCMPEHSRSGFDVILCNGLLGGPLLHGRGKLAQAVSSLAARLRPGGVLLAADSFHEGWKKKQQGELVALLRENLLHVVDAGEGVAAIRSGSAAHPRRDRRRIPLPAPDRRA